MTDARGWVSRRTKFPWLVLMVVPLLGSACSDEGCPAVSVCNVGELSCQQEVMEAVRCMRGGTAPLPPVSVVSEEQLLARIAGDDEPDEEAERAYEQWNRGLSLFRLAPPDYGSMDAQKATAAEYAAVYFSETKEIMIVDRGESLATPQAVETLAHEAVHALQDADYDLRALRKRWVTSTDSSLAIKALIEGEAVLYQLLVATALDGVDVGWVKWEDFFRRWRSSALEQADQDGAPVALAPVRFPYAFGGGFVMQHWLANGRAGVEALLAKPPLTTHEIMFGASKTDVTAEQSMLRDRGVPVLSNTSRQVGASSLGAWITRMFAARANVPIAQRLVAAQGLLGDVFSAHLDPTSGQVTAAWRTRMQEGFSPEIWPGASLPALRTWVELADRETYAVATEGMLPEAGALTWRSPSQVDDDGRQLTAAILSLEPPTESAGDPLGCNVRRPPLWSDDDASETK